MKDIFEFVPAGLYRSSTDGRLQMMNRHLATLLGFASIPAPTAIRVRDLYVDVSERDRLDAALARSGCAEADVRLKRVDGTIFWAEVRERRVEANGTCFVAGVLTDITDRKALAREAEQFRRAAEGSEEVTFITNRDGVFTYVNPAFTRLYGYAPEEVIGRCTPRILKAGRESSAYVPFWAAHLEGRSVRQEFTNQRKDGTLVLVDAAVNPIVSDDGTIVAFLAHQRNITSQRQTENALKESEALFRRVFDRLPAGIALQSTDGRFHRANPALCEILGRSEAELRTMTFLDVTHPDDREVTLALGKEIFAGKREHADLRKRYVRKDGAVVWSDTSVQLVRDADGRPLWAMPVVMDVTERLRLEQHVQEAQKMEAIGRLAGGIAHDFNNILTASMGYCEMLLENVHPNDPAWADLRHIYEGGQRAASLTRQLLAFSRKQMLVLEVVNVNEVLGRLKQFAQPLIGEDIQVDLELANADLRIRADVSQLEQIVMNLLVNARDAMPRGGRITMRTAPAAIDEADALAHAPMKPGEYVEVLVADTGTGMTEEVKQHLFEPFFTTKETGKGTGLGLATVYGIVKQMGGFIWVYSEMGRGSSFKIYFPRTVEARDATAVTARRPGAQPGCERVLLVEDDPGVRRFAAAVLTRQGYAVTTAASGEEALEHLAGAAEWPDLIITDVVMPGMNGLDFARTLAAKHRGSRVLFTSGYVGDHVRGGATAECADLLEKPFTATILLERVREMLDRDGCST